MAVTAVDLEQLAGLALVEASRWPARSPQRRAASHLYVSATIPPARSLAAVKRAVLSYGTGQVQDDALALLNQLTNSVGQSPTEQEQSA